MAVEDWRDERVRQAEDELASAVRTADEIIADAVAVALAGEREPAPPPADEPEPPPTILWDAW